MKIFRKNFLLFFSGKVLEGLKQWFHVQENIDQTLVASAIAACDATIYNQDEIGNFAGSLKVMESMALGVPIIATKLRAREIELGQDYPSFGRMISMISLGLTKRMRLSCLR